MKKTDKNQQNTASNRYDHSSIELKWQSKWQKEKNWHLDLDSANGSAGSPLRPFYNLMMFPYPSAEGLHIGGVRTFVGVDIYSRFKRMLGHDVFMPFGLDGFGIHAENYALKIGENPMDHAKVTEKNYYRQIKEAAISVDWDRTVETYKPEYYKWTQWLFVELFKAGLAYRKKSPVNFCPSCKTVLADEQVIDGKCERCSSIVEKKNLEQWFFGITQYADRLLNNIDGLDWTEKVKIAQRNWIGRSEGARIEFKVQISKFKVEVFTTAIDTIYGVTFMVISPEHPLVQEILKQVQNDKQVKDINDYVEYAKNKTEIERTAEGKEKTGVFSGAYAVNPFNNEQIPIWIADYVLMGYGTGAVMGVPGHDARDHEFAKKFNLPIKPVVKPKREAVGAKVEADWFWDYPEIKKHADKSELFDSGEFSGLTSAEAKKKMLEFIAKQGFGEKTTTYHLRDWLISRQRYWGPPIPMIYCQFCAEKDLSWFTTDEARKQQESGIRPFEALRSPQALEENQESGNESHNSLFMIHNSSEAAGWYPEEKLPVKLPYIEDFKPLGTGNSPLGNHPEFYEVKCPHCGKDARRETDVSDTFLDSSWYFLRYLGTDWNDMPFPSSKFKVQSSKFAQRARWLPVNMYIGGAEHSVLHLLYARFITMFLKDRGYIDFEEPFSRFYAHGLIIKEGAKMSKSRGNVVGPDIYIKKFGADTLRMYLHFLSPFSQDGDFRDSGVEGMNRFIIRVWKLMSGVISDSSLNNAELNAEPRRLNMMHRTIKNVTEEMEVLRLNTAIAFLMTWYNFLSKQESVSTEEAEVFLKLLAPFAPHMTEDLFQQIFRGQKSKVKSQKSESIHAQPWPTFDEKFIVKEIVNIPIQVNGKLRAVLEMQAGDISDKQKVEDLAKADEKVASFLKGQSVKKFIYIPGKIANFVVDTGKS